MQQYGDFLKTNKLSANKKDDEMVKRLDKEFKKQLKLILRRIIFQKNLKDIHWEFNLVESPEINAWCMPGGKVVVYTGILPITKDETGLAVVMGHEIAHAVAQHGAERMSQGLLQQLGGVALSVAIKDKPEATQNLFMTAYGVGTTVGVMLPYQ